MDVLLASFRKYHPFRGENSSILFHKRILETELEINVLATGLSGDSTKSPNRLSNFASLNLENIEAARQELRMKPDLGVLWFVPTLAQVPMVTWAMRGLKNPAGVFVEGAQSVPHGDWIKALLRMPRFFAVRAIVNGDLPCVFGFLSPRFPIAAASQWQLERAQRWYRGCKTFQIPNGSPGMPLHNRWKRPEKPNVRIMGHALYYKGADLALGAVKRARSQIPDLKLHWASTETSSFVMRRGLKLNWVVLHSQVDPYAFMSEATVVFVPLRVSSGTNVFPNIIIEAMSAGVPVLVSDLPCHRELLGDAAEMAIVPSFSPRVWAERLERLLRDPNELVRLSEALLRQSRSFWAVESLRGKWRAFLDAVADSRLHRQV